MKFSLAWLKEWLDLEISAEQVAFDLTSLGLEVESINNDNIFELSITPNRGDCLSILGIARELAVKYRQTIRQKAVINNKINSQLDKLITVNIQDFTKCPIYYGRVINNVNNQVSTPDWMAKILTDCGISSISPVVDVGNYVMLELGQPLHAFNLTKIASKSLQVRNAVLGEKIILLDKTELTLKYNTLVIADPVQPLAIAGVMGGLDSAISSTTTTIFIECAYFSPVPVRLAARDHAIQSDSAYRFERGVDPTMQKFALERATQLLLEIVGGEPSSIILPENSLNIQQTFSSPVILLRASRIEKLLGLAIESNIIEDILVRLNMHIDKTAIGWQVVPPAFRSDITIEADLIEEIARIYGYANIPSLLPTVVLSFKERSEQNLSLSKIRGCLQARSYAEAITYSFIDEQSAKTFSTTKDLLKLANPISNELAYMRPHLWPGLIKAIAYNQNRQADKIRFFETGAKFVDSHLEETTLAGACYGYFADCKWVEANRQIDFYDVKADVVAVLSLVGHLDIKFIPLDNNPVLHPGQGCKIIASSGLELGIMGMLHPKLEKMLDVKGPIFLFELNLSKLSIANRPKFKKISKFPAVQRDLALVVEYKLTSAELLDKLKSYLGDLLVSINLFDVYSGEKIAASKKSIALSLTLQHSERTLVDEEVNLQLEAMLKHLKEQDNIILRT